MKQILAVLAIVLILAGNSMAISWQWAGGLFGQNVFDANNNTAPINYPSVGFLPSPGHLTEGGEKFDLEGSMFAMDNNYLYFASTNSFGWKANSTTWHTNYPLGDFFFGFNGQKTKYGVDLTGFTSVGSSLSGSVYRVTSTSKIPNLPGSYYNNTSIRNQIGAFDIASGTKLGNINMYMHYLPGEESNPLNPPGNNGNTYVLEMRIARSLFGLDFSTINLASVHQTVACGNDLLEKSFDITVIPEPASLVLLGLGLLGGGLVARRKL